MIWMMMKVVEPQAWTRRPERRQNAYRVPLPLEAPRQPQELPDAAHLAKARLVGVKENVDPHATINP